MSDEPTPPTRSDDPASVTDLKAYYNNTTRQYVALGKFVESFELMVNEARETATDILTREAPDAIDFVHRKLVDVALHHPAVTAKPAFEIMRALIADYLKQLDVPIKECETFAGALSEIAGEYNSLAGIRNILLHGTWYVGFVSPNDPNAATFEVSKYKPTKTGLTKENAPKDTKELYKLIERCHKTRGWLAEIRSCLPSYIIDPQKVTETFVFNQGKWRLILPTGAAETLP